jgi:hypothetical protein
VSFLLIGGSDLGGSLSPRMTSVPQNVRLA